MRVNNLGPSYCKTCGKVTEHFRDTNFPCQWVIYVGYLLWPLLPLALIQKNTKRCCSCGHSSELSEIDKRNYSMLKKSGMLDRNGFEYHELFRKIGDLISDNIKQNGDNNISIEKITNSIYSIYSRKCPLPYEWYEHCVLIAIDSISNSNRNDDLMTRF